MTVPCNSNIIKASPKNTPENNKESLALYTTGILPAYIPKLTLFNHPSEDTNTTSKVSLDSTSMVNLKNSFEEWRSIKEDNTSPGSPTKLSAPDLSMEIFEGSLYHVIGSLDQDVFQTNSVGDNPTYNKPGVSCTVGVNKSCDDENIARYSYSSSPPSSLSDRLSLLLERVKNAPAGKSTLLSNDLYIAFENQNRYLSPVFRDQVARLKNAISVWVFDSLLSPSWKEFLDRMEQALCSSMADVQSAITKFGASLSDDLFPTQPTTDELDKETEQKQDGKPKSRFEHVPPPLSSSAFACPLTTASTGSFKTKTQCDGDDTMKAASKISSATDTFKDFAQPSASTLGFTYSSSSVSSLLTEGKVKTNLFFDKTTGKKDQGYDAIPKPSSSPKYVPPIILKDGPILNSDWNEKWSKDSTTSIVSTRSSGIEVLETLTHPPKSSSQEGSNNGEKNKKSDSLMSELGFEILE